MKVLKRAGSILVSVLLWAVILIAVIEAGVISGGMLPKVTNCISAVNAGVGRVHILDGRREHCLLLEFFTKKGIGTAIIGD